MKFIFGRQLNEMAFDRKSVIDKIKFKSQTILEHEIKCVVYQNTTRDLNHWIDEIAQNFHIINRYEAKTKSGKLKYEDYLENVFFCQGNTKRDMECNLMDFENNKDYPYFETNIDLINDLFDLHMFLAESCSTIFADPYNEYTKQDFKNLIKEGLERIYIY